MEMYSFLIVHLWVLLGLVHVSFPKQTCTTYDLREGKCVPLDSCNWILTKAAATTDVITNSKCEELSDFTTTVCCPSWKNNENCGRVNKPPETNSFPWIVDIVYHHRKRISLFKCAGSIISDRYVLTAAHCISDVPFGHKPYKIRLKNKPLTKYYDIQRITVHPNYTTVGLNKIHDIALFKLEKSVEFSEHIQPICLPVEENNSQNYIQKMLTIFSRGSSMAGQFVHKKHAISMPIHNNSICNDIYREINVELTESQLCVGGELGNDACPGDSGGPLMQQHPTETSRWYQVGMVSLGPRQCGGMIPGIYVNLLDYIDWIERTVDVDERA